MNSLTKSLIVCGVISTSMYAGDNKSCLDVKGKKEIIRFVDNKAKRFSYSLLKIESLKELLKRSNKAGVTASGEVFVKTSDSTTVSLGKVTNKCVTKPKVFASL